MSGEFTIFNELGEEERIPTKFEVCPRCRGVGSHVNPAIDGNGISPQEFADDPDFEEAYFRGDYDVACHRCDGKRVIAVPDFDRMDAETASRVRDYQREIDELEATEAAERRMGA